MKYRELKKRFNELSKEIKSYKEIAVVKSAPHELFEEQNKVAMKIMKLKSVHLKTMFIDTEHLKILNNEKIN